MMSRFRLCLSLMLVAVAPLRAETAPAVASWAHVTVTPMKTSIYIGSVTLSTETFVRKDSTLAANYTARVFPWFFWSETGRITITLTDANLASLARSEASEFTGEAFNHKNKPRKVTGRVQPTDAASGKIKVRILADGYELIFNGDYRFDQPVK